MPSTIAKEGIYQATPVRWELWQSPASASRGIAMQYVCTARLDEAGGTWVPCGMPYPVAEGIVFIVGKAGSVLERGVRDAHYVLGWPLDTKYVTDASLGWVPKNCEIEVKRDDWNGQERYRVAWINEPGSRVPQAEIGKEIMQHAADFARAIARGKSRGLLPSVPSPADEPLSAPDETLFSADPGAPTRDGIPF